MTQQATAGHLEREENAVAEAAQTNGVADAAAFRRGMRLLGGGVTIVATRLGSTRGGLTATAVCSLSTNPARLLACVNVNGSTYRLAAQSRRMSINVLAKGQEHIARRFAGLTGSRGEDPFELGEWHDGVTGAPILAGALVTFECVVNEMLVAHNHAILIGEVQEVFLGAPEQPLIYLDGAFTTVVGA